MNRSKAGAIILGSALIAVGTLVISAMVALPLIHSLTVNDWQPVPAELITAKVSPYVQQDEGGAWQSYFIADVRYRYQYQGRSYESNRVDLNVIQTVNMQRASSVVQNMMADAEDGLTVYVNPHNPEQAIYQRTPSWRFMIAVSCFSSLFFMAGGGIIALGFSKRSHRRLHWVTHPPHRIRLIWFATATLAATAGMFAAFLLFTSVAKTLVAMAMLALPIYLAWRALRYEQAWQCYLRAEPTLTPSEPMLGDTLQGNIIVPEPLSELDSYHVTLHNMQRHRPLNAGEPIILERWQGRASTICEPLNGETHIKFSIALIHDGMATQSAGHDEYYWVLRIYNARQGIVFDREYDLRVHDPIHGDAECTWTRA